MTPIVEKLTEELKHVLTVDITENLELTRKLGIRATPTLVLLRQGKVEKVKIGAQSELQIRKLLGAP